MRSAVRARTRLPRLRVACRCRPRSRGRLFCFGALRMWWRGDGRAWSRRGHRARVDGGRGEAMSAEKITLTLPDGSAKEFPAGTTPLEVARSIGERLAAAAVAGELDGDDRRPARADRALGEVPRADARGPRGGGRDPPLRRARARGRGRAAVPRHDHRRRPPGPLREVPVRLPLRPRRSRPRTSRRSRPRWPASSRRAARSSAGS